MAKFRAIVNAVRQTITGNATTADVLSGKTFMSAASPNEQTGAMTNNGAVSHTMTANGTYTIPAGYHNGEGQVTVNVPAGGTLTPVWENDTPDVNFSGQTINIADLTTNDTLIIIARTVTFLNDEVLAIADGSGRYQSIAWTGGGPVMYERIITINNGSVTFANAINSSNYGTSNETLIPLKIYKLTISLN